MSFTLDDAVADHERERTAEVTRFSRACEWTGVSDTNRAAWLEMRKTMLTASDMAAIIGEHPRKDAFTVYVEKTNPIVPETITIDDPRFWGSKLEQPILQIAAEYYGWVYRRGGFLLRSRKHPILGCTLDAEIKRSEIEGWVSYEGKTSKLEKDWDEDSGLIPRHVLVQKQTQLLVIENDVGVVFGLLQGCRPSLQDINAYAKFQDLLVSTAEWFMELIRRGEPPTPTAKARDALKRLYPDENGEVAHLGIEQVEWTREIQEIKAQMKTLDARRGELTNMLRQTIGHATFGELPERVDGFAGWKWSTDKNGSRNLRAVKRIGNGQRILPAPVSLEALPEHSLIEKYATNRRRSRR